ncbi:family 78 glycoside hydrolase catalytic domain [Microbacterium sp. NM3R9]|uniref:alpha-L-rhamnosidase n=1 Tax=Microbacterium thalli TaxID=3027921 RepID=UPI002365D9D8|nr:alpha-L-rhamnosidase [Microbacterium thalli]MDN8547934.1 family 78 glycoside hydrolase catalytic domain [Microbacterium thalli]
MTIAHEPRVVGLRVGRRRDISLAASARPPVSWLVEAPAAWKAARAELRLDRITVAAANPYGVLEEWPFPPLQPGDVRTLEVRVVGVDGSASAWSEAHEIRARFTDEPWTAPFLGLARPARAAQPFLARRAFAVAATVISAELRVAAHGVYHARLNGADVDDGVLHPGWTAYQHRLPLQLTDVSALLRPGEVNTLAVEVAGGWYTETYGFGETAERFYGDQPGIAPLLRLRHKDGRIEDISGDERWRLFGDGELVSSGIYAGEEVDLRRHPSGWETQAFDDAAWEAPALARPDRDPVPIDIEPVRRIRSLPVVAVPDSADPDRVLLDFGQNLVGRVRFRVSGPAGTRIVLRHAEVIDAGRVNTRPLRAAAATDTFVLDGAGDTVCEPRFTFHGFRYVEVTGYPGELDPTDFAAVVLHTDLTRTGWFSCSDERLNRLHENIVWSFAGNALSLPTDCPQRDERLGWTGDAQVFAPTAASLFDADAFFASWLTDVVAEQASRGGRVPTVVPQTLGSLGETMAAGWGDAITVIPTVLHERFGDQKLLARMIGPMRAWVDAVSDAAGPDRLWERGFQYGDWLDPTVARPDKAKTDPGLVATAYFARSARLVSDALDRAGDGDAATRYAVLADDVRGAFVATYVTPRGRLASDAPTAYALALEFDLLPAALRPAAAERLAFLLRAGGYRMATGFLGTPLVLDALLSGGQEGAAEQLLLQTMCPSWLYPLSQGATTVWERWDGIRPDGTLHPSGMTSFNHYALGSVGDVLHRRVGGLACDAPGWSRLRIQPWFISSLQHARVAHDTPRGRAGVEWHRDAAAPDRLRVRAQVPHGVTAWVDLGDRAPFEVGAGDHTWEVTVALRRSPEIGVDTDLAVIADAPGACAAVSRTIAVHSPEMATEFDAYIRWVPGRRLRDELAAVSAPAALVARIDAALAGVPT